MDKEQIIWQKIDGELSEEQFQRLTAGFDRSDIQSEVQNSLQLQNLLKTQPPHQVPAALTEAILTKVQQKTVYKKKKKSGFMPFWVFSLLFVLGPVAMLLTRIDLTNAQPSAYNIPLPLWFAPIAIFSLLMLDEIFKRLKNSRKLLSVSL